MELPQPLVYGQKKGAKNTKLTTVGFTRNALVITKREGDLIERLPESDQEVWRCMVRTKSE